MANTVTLPDTTIVIDQNYLIQPLGGPQNPRTYLDRFPEEVYNKAIDSRLVRFIYALLGPAGIGWLRKEYLQARLMLEELNLETFNLNSFYGDPLKFGRIVEEIYDDDPSGLISRDEWQAIKARDAQYRNRAIDFINGARLGNTPAGMHLVARSGLGHEVEIIEHYQTIYDRFSDDHLFLNNYGQTSSTEEMVVLPRRELSRSEVQSIIINGDPTGGTFRLLFPVGNEIDNTTPDIPYNADSFTVRGFLEGIGSIGPNIEAEGGPLPDTPIKVTFTRALANRDVPKLIPTSQLSGGTLPDTLVVVDQSGIDASDEVVEISPRDQHYLQTAVDRIRPQTTIPTVAPAPGLRKRQIWQDITASSSYTQVVRYATGQSGVRWPTRDQYHWIEVNVEHEGRLPFELGSQHYTGFHNLSGLNASSEHRGFFYPHQTAFFPILRQAKATSRFSASNAVANYTEPLIITLADGTHQFVNDIYPIDYQTLPGVPRVKADPNVFWASEERTTTTETLSIDLGSPQAVNYIYFEMTRKPVLISLEYELEGGPAPITWVPVTLNPLIQSNMVADFDFTALNPWVTMQINCLNGKGDMIFARYLRLTFTRQTTSSSPFVDSQGNQLPWSIEVRNLRVGRNVV